MGYLCCHRLGVRSYTRLLALAAADGRVAAEEKRALESFRRQADISAAQMQRVSVRFGYDLHDSRTRRQIAQHVYHIHSAEVICATLYPWCRVVCTGSRRVER